MCLPLLAPLARERAPEGLVRARRPGELGRPSVDDGDDDDDDHAVMYDDPLPRQSSLHPTAAATGLKQARGMVEMRLGLNHVQPRTGNIE
jgi:hypothetical protein